MHVAFALMLGVRWRASRAAAGLSALWVAYPAVVTFMVVATANHWWFDAALGARHRGPPRCAAQALLARARPEAWAWQPAPGTADAARGPLRMGADVDATSRAPAAASAAREYSELARTG